MAKAHLTKCASCRSLFYMARVGLGSLGVISEITLQAVPAHRLLEHTFVSSMKASLAVCGDS